MNITNFHYNNLNLIAHIPKGIVIAGNNVSFINDTFHYGHESVFLINDTIGLAFYGVQTIEGELSSVIINDYINNYKSKITIDNISDLLLKYFAKNYDKPNLYIYICGYQKVKNIYRPIVNLLDIHNNNFEQVNVINNNIFYNYHWGGDTDILEKLFREVKIRRNDEWIDLDEINIEFGYSSIEEATKFCDFCMKTNLTMQGYTTATNIKTDAYKILIIEPNKSRWE